MTSRIDANTLSLLQHKRIYFGHQSVGANILDGVRDLCGHSLSTLNIVESGHSDALASPAIVHSAIGHNQNPRSKVEAFAEILASGLGNRADIAFFKFCYVDVTAGSDISGLFNYYRQVMAELVTAYPRTRILHVTVPVTVMPGLVRRLVGQLRGKRNRAAYDNLARADYNRLLLRSYTGKEPVFDLAKSESTTSSGRQLQHSLEGRMLHTLVPAYSNDGRHLSETGRRIMAADMLRCLAEIATETREAAHG